LAFLAEADNLKSVLRATTLCDGSRRENSAEHSWHLALFGLIFGEHGPDAARVITMLLLHDLVEIDAGDTPIHGVVDQAAQDALEAAAADRIFGLLPDWQNAELRAIWEEFEAAQSEDAVFAKSLDRVQPVICNLMSGGGSWVDYKVTFEQLESRVAHKVRAGFPLLWDTLEPSIRDWFAQNTKS
jgi:putative hydrolase of HD superfamily